MQTVDIILFCYKQEQYIEQALRSIYTQELPEDVKAQIIVADDASPDATLHIVKRLAHESPFPIVFLPEEANMGISKNYKRSFAATKAEYVAILEGDDYWLANHIAQHLDFLNCHPDCSMSMNSITSFHEPTGLIHTKEWPTRSDYIKVDLYHQISEGNHLGNLSSCVFRGAHIRELPDNLFDIPIADWMLGIMMAQKGDLAILRYSTSIYRLKESGVWAGKGRWESHVSMLKDAERYDRYLQRKYHSYWMKFKSNKWAEFRKNWIHYFPQWLKNIGKRIINM